MYDRSRVHGHMHAGDLEREVDAGGFETILADDPYAVYLWQLQSLTGLTSKVKGWKAHAVTYVLMTNASVSG